jgi:trimeric autotransporter adhesin
MKTFTTVLTIIIGMAYLAFCTPIMNQIYATTTHWLSEKNNQPNPTKSPKSNVAFEPQSFKGIPFVIEQKQQIVSPVAVTIAATLSAAVVTDNAPTGASATDVLEYTAVVSNSGSTDATGVVFTDVLDNNTTLVAGSITSTPIAVDDNYTCVGNVGISVNAASGVLANDVSPTNTARTVTAASGATANGTYSIAADGSFSYTPNVGFTGTNSFTYILTTGTLTTTATVTITVSGMIWFVNPSVSSSGSGTLASPFKALSNIAGTATGHTIFLYTGTYTGALTLLASQRLIGQGATASLASITGLTFSNPPATLPSTGGTNPTWNTAALTIVSGNDVEGIDLNSTTGTTMTGGASNVGALKVRDVNLANTGGQALQIASGGVLDVIFKSISAGSSVKGISVSSSTGSFQVVGTSATAGSGGTIQNMTTRGAEFVSCASVSLKNMNFTNANTSTSTCGTPAANNSACNAAIHLQSIATTAAFDNIVITGTTNSMGININNVSGFTLANSTLTACGSTNATAAETGGIYALNLAGTCSIANTNVNDSWGRGFYLYNGILSINPTVNLTVTGCQFKNSFNRSNGADNFIFNGYGTTNNMVTIKRSDFSNSRASGLQLNFGNSSVNTIQVGGTSALDGNTITAAASTPGSNGFSLQGVGTSVINYNIYNNNFQSSFNGGLTLNVGAQANCTMQGRVNSNTVTHVGVGNADGIGLAAYNSSTHKAEVLNNTISGTANYGIIVESNDNTVAGSTARMDATVKNNNVSMVANSYAHVGVIAVANNVGTNGLKTCINVGNNTTNSPVSGLAAGQFDVLSLLTGNQVILQGTTAFVPGGSADKTPALITFWNANNVGVRTAVDEVGGGSIISGTCLVPSNLASSIVATPVLVDNLIVSTDSTASNRVESVPTILKETPSVSTASGNGSNTPEAIFSGETVTVNGSGSGFTLAAGKSTTIKFKAAINTGIAAGTCAVSTQGTVSSPNFSNVSTNTVSTTIVSAPDITTCPAALTICSNASQSFAAIASGCPTPTLTYKIGSTIITSPYVFPDGISTVDVTASNGVGANATCSFIVNNTYTLPTSTPATGLSVTQNVSNPIFKNNCEIYATVTPLAPSPIAGSTTVKTWLETGAFTFVKRHYEITPSANVNTAMATIILYFTQTDFDGYNAVNATKLPLNASDAANNKANLQIVKYAGSALNGLPAQYGTAPSIITPTSVVWNGNFWVVTFNVTGFSGFFVKTSSLVLPVSLLSFEGKKLNSNTNLLTWHVADEKDLKAYDVEKSTDGKTFKQVGIVKAKGSNSVYEFTDKNPIGGLSGLYYRLKMIDLDEKFEYSNIINLENDKILRGVKIYPNPTSNVVNIEIEGALNKPVQVFVKDIGGRVVLQQTLTTDNSTIIMSSMTGGLYILEAQFADGQKQSFKLVKQ